MTWCYNFFNLFFIFAFGDGETIRPYGNRETYSTEVLPIGKAICYYIFEERFLMKKALIPALAAGLALSASASAFAAANPFSDLPADHWAYDAVTQLAEDGIVEGYGDSTFRGDRNITRYEMAQMVAKLMARTDLSATDKALLDKLAAEFSEELNNLGVRVANLERNADMVKWTGEMRYQYWSERTENRDGSKDRENLNNLRLRFNPEAEVNEHWKVKARMQADVKLDKDSGPGDRDKMKVVYAYADGNYGKWNFSFGRMPLWSDADEGLTVDDYFSGFQVLYGSKLKVKLEAGRWDLNNNWDIYSFDDMGGLNYGLDNDVTSNYQGIELNYANGKLNAGATFRHFDSDGWKNAATQFGRRYSNNGTADDAKIWSIGARYTFDRNVSIMGAFAQNTEADNLDSSHNIELDYKNADKNNPGSWGAYVAYRYASPFVSLTPTYDVTGMRYNKKGWDVGVKYTLTKNVVGTLAYFNGKKLDTNRDSETLFGYLRVFF